MNKYSISILGNIRTNRTEAEISFISNWGCDEAFVGTIYEDETGWIVEYEDSHGRKKGEA